MAIDGTDDSNIGTTTLSMVAQNNAPVLNLDADDSSGENGADYATTFTENGGAILVADGDATLSDVDNTNLQSLCIEITNLLDGVSEVLSANTTGTSITASYDSGTGILTLSGADTVANYQQVLRTVSYNNTSENPTTTDRSITFVANDGTDDSNIGTTTLAMVAQNDAPVLDLDADDSSGKADADFAMTFTEKGGAVLIADADVTLSDVDSPNLQSLTVTITNLLDGASEVLAADTSGTSISAGYNNGVLILSGADTVAHYQQVLRTVTYNNSSDNPTTTARSITFVANDGTANSNVGTTTLTVTPVNDAPVLAAIEGTPLTYTENDPATATTATITASDVDNTNLASATIQITSNYQSGKDMLSFTDTASITGSWNAANGTLTLSGSDTVASYEAALRAVKYQNTSDDPSGLTRTVSFKVNDGTADSNLQTRSIALTPVNDAPVLDLDGDNSSGQAGADFANTWTENDGPVAIADGDATLSDVDSADLVSLTVTLTNRPDGAAEVLAADTTGTSITATYAGEVLTLSGSDSVAHYQQVLRTLTYDNTSEDPTTTARVLSFVANDGTDDSNIGTTTLTMVAQNDAPMITSDGGADTAGVSILENTTFVTTVTATDIDDDTPTYSISRFQVHTTRSLCIGLQWAYVHIPFAQGARPTGPLEGRAAESAFGPRCTGRGAPGT